MTLKNEEVADAKYGSNRKVHPSLRQQSNHYEGGQIRCSSLEDQDEDDDYRMMKSVLSQSTSAEQLFRVRTQMKTERSTMEQQLKVSSCAGEPANTPGLQTVSVLHQISEI